MTESVPTHRLYVDEVGNPGFKAGTDPNQRYLSLTGVIIAIDEERTTLVNGLDGLRNTHFGGRPKFFHRKELVNKRDPFAALRNPAVERAFNADLLNLLKGVEYVVVTVIIDKLEHLQRYQRWRFDPYHYSLEIMLERYVRWLRDHGAVGDVMAESRGGGEDRRLKAAFSQVYEQGTDYVEPQVFAERLTSRQLKLEGKLDNIAGLQLADLIAHPSYRGALARQANQALPGNFGGQIAAILESSKYHRSPQGRIRGWGVKWLP
jgi:hypothetical protein